MDDDPRNTPAPTLAPGPQPPRVLGDGTPLGDPGAGMIAGPVRYQQITELSTP